MPLGVRNPVDPVQYMKKNSPQGKTRAAQDFLAFVREKTEALEAEGLDTGRLLTVFNISLQSIKKIDKADIVAGISKEEISDAVIVSRRVDPNFTYPLLQKDVLSKVARKISSYDFQAVVFWFDLRANNAYCWRENATNSYRWSPEVVQFIDRLTDREIKEAHDRYTESRKGPSARR